MYIYGSYRKIKTGITSFGPPCMHVKVRLSRICIEAVVVCDCIESYLTKQLQVSLAWELLYADDLILSADSKDELCKKIV